MCNIKRTEQQGKLKIQLIQFIEPNENRNIGEGDNLDDFKFPNGNLRKKREEKPHL